MSKRDKLLALTKWDSRTPLERFLSLNQQEQSAFLAFFAGARGNLQGAWRADTEQVVPITFGKAECEWVSFHFWRYKLPGLRLTTYSEGERRPALGMVAGSVVWPISIEATDDGITAREEYWASIRTHADTAA